MQFECQKSVVWRNVFNIKMLRSVDVCGSDFLWRCSVGPHTGVLTNRYSFVIEIFFMR